MKTCLPVGVKREGNREFFVFPLKDENIKNLIAKSLKNAGGYLTLDLSLPRKPRTTGELSQNHAINGYCQQIAQATGNEFGDVKIAAKIRALKRGYPFKKDEKGNPIISLITGVPEPESETRISTTEAGYLINEIIMIASELGIVIEG